MKTCPVCFQKFQDVDAHVRAEHPQYEVRIVNAAGESMSTVGYFQGSPPDWLQKANGKSLDKVTTTSTADVAKRLKHRAAEHEAKAARAFTDEGRANHNAAQLYVQVIVG